MGWNLRHSFPSLLAGRRSISAQMRCWFLAESFSVRPPRPDPFICREWMEPPLSPLPLFSLLSPFPPSLYLPPFCLVPLPLHRPSLISTCPWTRRHLLHLYLPLTSGVRKEGPLRAHLCISDGCDVAAHGEPPGDRSWGPGKAGLRR